MLHLDFEMHGYTGTDQQLVMQKILEFLAAPRQALHSRGSNQQAKSVLFDTSASGQVNVDGDSRSSAVLSASGPRWQRLAAMSTMAQDVAPTPEPRRLYYYPRSRSAPPPLPTSPDGHVAPRESMRHGQPEPMSSYDPAVSFYLVGTWDDWQHFSEFVPPASGARFFKASIIVEYVAPAAKEKVEEFQIVQDQDWGKRFYPATTGEIAGPTEDGGDMNWKVVIPYECAVLEVLFDPRPPTRNVHWKCTPSSQS